jgi:peptidyl-prolyl cis-trans isomerase SurA
MGAGAQTAKKSASGSTPTRTESDGGTQAKGTQAIVVLVNDEPVTAWEIEQRAGFIIASGGGNGPKPSEMKAKAEARWAAIIKDPKTNERFQQVMREKGVTSREQAQAVQAEFVKKLQTDMIEQIKREARPVVGPQTRKQAQEELIDDRLKIQEGKKLGIEISDDDAKKLVQGIAERNKLTLEQFSAHVKQAGFDISTLRERLRADQVWRELIRRRYGAQISIAEKDVDRLVSAAAEETGEDAFELQVQKITLPVQGRGDQTAFVRRYSEAEAMHSKFDGCKSMANLVKDAADAKFEDLKYVRPSNLPEPTRSLLLVAKDGDMLPPATSANSIEIYAVCGRRSLKVDEKQREKATQELQAKEFDIAAKRRLFDLRQEAHIEYR